MQGEKGTGQSNNALHCKGSILLRLIFSFLIQGGDSTYTNSCGGALMYGFELADEKFTLRHTGTGILLIASSGTNTNGLNFFICSVKSRWSDDRHVGFRMILSGLNFFIV